MNKPVTITFWDEGKHKFKGAKREVDGYCITTPSGYFQKEWIKPSDLQDILTKERRDDERQGTED